MKFKFFAVVILNISIFLTFGFAWSCDRQCPSSWLSGRAECLAYKAASCGNIGGTCGVQYGNAKVYVRNKTGSEKIFKVNGSSFKPGKFTLKNGQEKIVSVCNQKDIISVSVFTSARCGETYLGRTRAVRVYKKEVIDINNNGEKFHINDVTRDLAAGAGIMLTTIAMLEPSKTFNSKMLEELGVREASVINNCMINPNGCLFTVYDYLSPRLQNTIRQDQCLANQYRRGAQQNGSGAQRGITSQRYADDATKMAKANKDLGCGYSGGRWSLDWKAHHNWANTVSKSNLISEYKNRRKLLIQCIQSLAHLRSNPSSQKYANDAVKMAKGNKDLGCGYSGGRWSLDWKAHHNWANTVSKSNLISEYKNRRDLFINCVKNKY